jgi:sulfite exporter TauE/SafE/copper chaperone CopZ
MNENQKIYKFNIRGMHCKSCVLMTESELKEFPYIKKVTVSLKSNLVEVIGDFGEKNPEEIAEELSVVLKPHGYTLHAEGFNEITETKIGKSIKWKEFRIAIPITIIFVVVYVILQKIGLVNLLNVSNVSYGSAFLIGVIASLSSCMAVVGGLLLSMSASFAKGGDKIRPQIMFHVSRFTSFFILGGIIGLLGKAFQLNTTGTFVLGIIIAMVMFMLGINLLDVFPWAKRLQPGMPKFLSRHAFGVSKINHILTPVLVGVATFFLPCGFTQSMQIYTLSTGDFMTGGLIMLSFALGTFPVLAMISFSSAYLKKNSNSGIFFKTAGLIVILFALFNLINALVVVNALPPIFNF